MQQLAQKWNFKTKKYENYILSNKAILFTMDMDEIVSCSSCGKSIIYGKTYTSKKIHNHYGLGYPVCEECYKKELSEAQEN